MPSNIESWFSKLTPEEREAHKAKMAAGRARYRETKASQAEPVRADSPTPPPSPTPLHMVEAVEPLNREQALAPEYAPVFRKLLGEYLDILACMTGGGTYTDMYCRLCVQSGIHGAEGRCGCPCHRTRAALASFTNGDQL